MVKNNKMLLSLILVFFMTMGNVVYSVARYLFLQQFNDMCLAAPMINLKLLEDLLHKYPDITKIPDDAWLTRRQWFGEEFKYLHAWHKAFDKANTSDAPHFNKYMQEGVRNGPVAPHYYDQQGNLLLKNMMEPGSGIDAGMAFTWVSSYFFIDANFISLLNVGGSNGIVPRVGLFVPFVKEKETENYLLYNASTRIFETLKHAGENFLYMSGFFDRKQRYDMLSLGKNNLGFDEIAYATNPLGRGFRFKSKCYVPYTFGLAKLMFLTLGIDENNQPLTASSDQFGVSQELQLLVREDVEFNPWSPRFFDKENFIQYKLAEMFINDPALFAQAQEVVDILPFKLWENYKVFLESIKKRTLYRFNRRAYDYNQVKQYFLGDEQALAYFFTQQVRQLWYGTLNEEIFNNYVNQAWSVLEKYGISNDAVQHDRLFTGLVTCALLKKTIGSEELSFLDVWRRIVEKFKQCDRKHWVSFDGHGWVISFDKQLIALQKRAINNLLESEEKKQERLELLHALRCTGIESSHSTELNSFYKC